MKRFVRGLPFIIIIGFLTISAASEGKIKVKMSAPSFSLEKLDGSGEINLKNYRGKVVLIDFWATWCPPCKESLPFLNKMQKKYKNFEVIAINIDDDRAQAQAFLEEQGLSLNAAYDSSKSVVALYDVPAMPTAYLVDQYGKVRFIHTGYSSENVKKLEFAIRGLVDFR